MFGIFILFQICIYFTFSILPITFPKLTYFRLILIYLRIKNRPAFSTLSPLIMLPSSNQSWKQKKTAFEINIYFSAKCTIAFTTYLEFSRMMKNICIETISYRTLKYYNSEFLVVTLIVFTNYI